jgi:hypothetical protein
VADLAEIDERYVASLWESQSFDPRALSNLGLHLIFRGLPSDAGGPDYQDCMFAQGGEVFYGDVEFHVRSSDWFRHGHHRDRRYNRVILHVVWRDDVPTVRSDDSVVPTISLADHAPLRPSDRPRSRRSDLLPHPCVVYFTRLAQQELLDRIIEAGLRRFLNRVEMLATDISSVGRDQAAYAALLESLGYASNREAFRRLADVAPYAWLAAVPVEQRADALIWAADLGPEARPEPPARLSVTEWRIQRLRPANHPARRLRGIAAVLTGLGASPADRLCAAVQTAQRGSDLRELILSAGQDYSLIGPGRADEIVVSVVLPLVQALNPNETSALDWYRGYPSPPSNRWTRFMLGCFEAAGHIVRVRRAAEHQGIHHLYHEHCRYERRSQCPVCSVV